MVRGKNVKKDPRKMVTGNKVGEKTFSDKEITGKFTEESWRIFLFSSTDRIRRPHTPKEAHPTIPHTPNCGKRACGACFTGDFFSRGPLFPGLFSGDHFSGDFWSGDFFSDDFFWDLFLIILQREIFVLLGVHCKQFVNVLYGSLFRNGTSLWVCMCKIYGAWRIAKPFIWIV